MMYILYYSVSRVKNQENDVFLWNAVLKLQKIFKKTEKTLKKVLTIVDRCDILHERSKRGRKNNGPWKLNNKLRERNKDLVNNFEHKVLK